MRYSTAPERHAVSDHRRPETALFLSAVILCATDPDQRELPLPRPDLPGNSTGFTESPVSLASINVATYGTLRVGAVLATEDSMLTPELESWEVSYIAGPSPLPNVSFDVHGGKTIGTDSGGQPLYKYDESFTTTSAAEWLIDPLEWDTYTLMLTSNYDVAERCPHVVAPALGQDLSVSVTLSENTARSLRLVVSNDVGAPVQGASVSVSGPQSGNATTGTCGQVYFGGLSSGIYTVTVSKAGFQTHEEEVGISGDTEHEVGLLPN